MRILPFIFCAFLPAFASATAAVGSAGRLAAALKNADDGTPFDLVATVAYVSTNRVNEQTNVALADDTGDVLVRAEDRRGLDKLPCAGARARFQGFIERNDRNRRFAVLTNYHELAIGSPPLPVTLSRNELLSESNVFRLCRFQGTLRDVATNETSPGWLLLTVCDASGMVYATVPTSSNGNQSELEAKIGSQVSLTGICVPYDHSTRFRSGRIFKVPSFDRIEVLPETTVRGNDFPSVGDIPILEPVDFAALGRHRAIGRIIAAWMPNRAILRDDGGNLIGLEFDHENRLPRYGDKVEAVGLPETDSFQLILYRADWKQLKAPPMADETAERVSPRTLTHESDGRRRTTSVYHGHAITMHGIVRGLSKEEGQLTLECEGTQVSVDASALPSAMDGVFLDCIVDISGICAVYVEAPRMNSAVPRIKGFSLVIRRPEDIHVVSTPAWWTPRKLTFVISALFALLCVILVWNTMLRRLAERRANALANEMTARASADLKVYERTRLAVELHDSIAQNLTGIALEIGTAERLSKTDHDQMREHLGIAMRALKSCRNELRNCLWDLRHQTLESDSMEAAIRQTLEPCISNVRLSIRFKVPRERISDNSAHAILSIIRELSVNAIRHGQATDIKVAGNIEDRLLKFSVRDNGCGFDPTSCPGDEQGHYGLLGIRERVNSFEGQMDIQSVRGRGTKVTIRINIPQEKKA